MTEAGQDRLLRETWYRAIAGSGYVPLRADQVRERLGELLTVATRILQEERFDRQAAEGIGRALVAMHYLQPQAVGRTVGLFARELLAPLPVEQAVALQPRLADLLDALVAGYFRQAYDTVLMEQDEVRSALLAELRATELALRQARDDLEVRVHERTAELARANRELRAEIERRQQVEHALRESEARHRRLVECSDDLIFSLDRAGTFCTAGGFRLREFGLEPHEVIGRRLDDLFPPEKAREYHERHRHVFDSGQALTYEHDFEFDGVTRTDLTTIYPIPNEQGEIEQVGVICRDVTVHKRAEQALRESEERYRDLVDASPTGIFALQDGRYVFANPAGRRLLGYDPGELIGVLAVDTIHPDSLQLVLDRMETAQDGGPNPPVEMKVVRRDGSTLLTESTSVPVTLNGEPAILIIGQDISARKQAEAERLAMERRLLHAQKLESLGVLAGGIAHDFNNLLMAVLGNLDVARQDLAPTSPARASVESAVQACRRAVDLTRQMLAYSGKGHFVLTHLDLSHLVRENAFLFRASISRTVTMNMALASGLPPIQADPGQLQQVVMNLITNASEAIEGEVGVVTLATGVQDCGTQYLRRSRLDEKPPPGRFVYLEVSDTGCGMDAETQDRIFDPFFTTKFTGRGLGMAAVMGIVRGHGGAIMVDSQLGVGSTIRVLFPSAGTGDATPAAPSREEAAALPPDPEPMRSGTILVVDDEPHVRQVCRRILERLGFQVVTAADGQQALDLFGEQPDLFLCVLLDLTMPGMDGVATFRQLKRLQPDVKVILFSGYDESEAIRLFTGEGLAGFIQKPFGVQELQSRLESILNPD